MARSKTIGVALVSVLLGAGVLSLMGFGLASAQPHQPALMASPTGTRGHVALTISVYPDSQIGGNRGTGGAHPDWVSYSNDNLVVPANSVVDMTVKQYDSGGELNNSVFGNVFGTIGNTMNVNGTEVSSWDPTSIGHTFTLRGISGDGTRLMVSVPLPFDTNKGAENNGGGVEVAPMVVKFSFKTGGKGVYQWNCEFPCGGSRQGQFGEAMSTYGYMSGTLTVK